MLFNSQALILGLLPLALAGWYLAPTRVARQVWVVLASLVFYAFWDLRFVPVLVGLTLLNWLVARAHAGNPRGWWADLGIAMNLGVLGWVKYANFVADNVAWILGGRHEQWNIILPLGVSFYVFQKVSYLIDLKRGQAKTYRLSDFFLFVTFFPQLVAGPLVRHNEVIWQFALDPRRPEMAENLARGFVLFTIGLVKKVAIADTVAPVADAIFGRAAGVEALGAGDAWLGTLAYTLQIYFDFSGYSDMALGLAMMFGLRLPANFDAPYRSASIREFWRRWHMTLSRFLRDYLYVPMGGNRAGAARQAVNVIVTMLLGGLWHGAAWTFVAWGGLHGIALAVNGAWARAGLRMPWVLGWALTMLFVMVGWVLFRAPDFATAARMLGTMAGGPWTGGAFAMDTTQTVALLGGCVAAVFGPASQTFALERLRAMPWVGATAGVVLFLMLLLIGGRVPNEFIYFQF
ncbi:MBOAT family O-acyltransferase [Neoroseomonas soli]|uniref:Probable alginate O-acetylase AlgI n=1 Tax=Neoroseomonas soli TaxID=1081025 RepID=A0A9X9WW78_9PROT|nr:MBOAT family protein [Neoroseomonas soli]MBR0671407.1 MBOAT family protein [Neoroseomonas soli]